MNRNRVYVIDRECYVIYMGKADRKYRPFLRIGSSAFIPRDIRRHIGSVILTDRMTGNYFLEADCLEKPVSHHMHYVGPQELVDAVRHFIRNEQIADQPLGPASDVEKEEGGRVVFYNDGNLRAYLDGHRLFDLFESEKRDRHSLYQLQRIHDIVSGIRGAYREQDLTGHGFVLLPNGAPILYADGQLQSVYLDEQTVEQAAYAMLPLGLLRCFSGQAQRDTILNFCKWQKTRSASLDFVLAPDAETADPDTAAGGASALLQLMEQAGVSCRQVEGLLSEDESSQLTCLPKQPGLQLHDRLSAVPECLLDPPEGIDWIGGSGVHPPMLRGVLYRLDRESAKDDLNAAQTSLQRMMGKQARDLLEDYAELSEGGRRDLLGSICGTSDQLVQLAVRLWAWNQRFLGQEIAEAATLSEEIESGHRLLPMPVTAFIHRHGRAISQIFLPIDGMSRGVLDACAHGREKVAAVLEIPDRQRYFQSERARLSDTLHELLAARHVVHVEAPVSPAKTSQSTAAGAATGSSDSTAAGESIGVANSTTAAEENTAVAGAEPERGPEGQSGHTPGQRPGKPARSKATHAKVTGEAASKANVDGGRQRAGADQHAGFRWHRGLNRWLAAAILLLLIGAVFILLRSRTGPDLTERIATGHVEQIEPADTADPVESAEMIEPSVSGDSVGPDEPGVSGTDGTDGTAADAADPGEPMAPGEQTAPGDLADTGEPTDPIEPAGPGVDPADSEERSAMHEPDAAESKAESTAESKAESLPGSVRDIGSEPEGHLWSIQEVLRVTNWIAYNNGYAPIGEATLQRRDPDWIYPDNEFTLPDGSVYRVRQGESMWLIASGFLAEMYRTSRMEREEFRAFIKSLDYTQTVWQWNEQ